MMIILVSLLVGILDIMTNIVWSMLFENRRPKAVYYISL